MDVEVTVDGSTLRIGQSTIQSDRGIEDFLVHDDIIIVAYEWEHPEDDNLEAFDRRGNQLWENPDADTHETAFQSLNLNDGKVVGITWEAAYEIHPESGELDPISPVR